MTSTTSASRARRSPGRGCATPPDYDVLQFAQGGALAGRLRPGISLPLAEALQLTVDAGRGLYDLHPAELIHRGIRPENIFIAADGRAQVGDPGSVR